MKMEMTFGQFSEANRARCESQQGFNHPNALPDLVKALEELLRVSAEETCTHKEFGEAVAAARAALSKYRGAGE